MTVPEIVKALIIDDARTVRLMLGKMLQELGYDVIVAADGMEGLAALEATPEIELVLVDWNMPVMDGYEFLCAVRRDGKATGRRIMMVTTENEMTQVVRALEAGAHEYLMKPFCAEALREKLALLGCVVAA